MIRDAIDNYNELARRAGIRTRLIFWEADGTLCMGYDEHIMYGNYYSKLINGSEDTILTVIRIMTMQLCFEFGVG